MKDNLLVHKHLIIRAESKRPPKDEEHIVDWMREFVDNIGMKVLMGPYAKYLDITWQQRFNSCSDHRNFTHCNAYLG
jgi:hypothetical protein